MCTPDVYTAACVDYIHAAVYDEREAFLIAPVRLFVGT